MTRAPSPDSLRPGDLVGPWRIEGYIGRGSYGAVFQARRAGHPSSPPVALKVALCSYDPRFVREEVLLNRVRHPSVPQLIDRGWWHSAAGVMHPYVVMELIRGMPLYDWAAKYNPTSRQVLQVMAQVAWALEVVHRADALHRDVRGDNILVEPEGRAVLTDFGSGREIGEAAESAQEHSGPAADVPLRGSERPKPQAELVAVPLPVVPLTVSKSPEVEGATVPAHVPVGTEGCSRRVLLAASVVVGLSWLWWMAPETGPAEPEVAQMEPPEMSVVPEDGPTGLGDGGVTARVTSQDAPDSAKVIALDMPKKPLPNQRRAPCQRRAEVEINGGCWAPWLTLSPPCGEPAYEWNGACYLPLFVNQTRVPTTDKQGR